MDFVSNYEVSRVADFIHRRKFRRVALQFPDELLKDSTRVVSCLRQRLRSLGEPCHLSNGDGKDIGLYVMADSTYGSCCVDEVGASHINADCVIHYGHTCLSPTSTLPTLFVFGKASINPSDCAENICSSSLKCGKPVLVLFGLEYAYAVQSIKDAAIVELSKACGPGHIHELRFAEVKCSMMEPTDDFKASNMQQRIYGGENYVDVTDTEYCIGGLTWSFPKGSQIDDYLLFWVGSDNAAFSNLLLTFNSCEIVRYDAEENCLLNDFSNQKRIIKRRYYLVEKAKDANMVGILVGTLGVAGYLHLIHQMKELVTEAGKKAYTFVMGKPNPAKLANFPECDIFIYVSCAQTALLDSKEFLAPVITPFEAMLAFRRGVQWTGTYVMEFRDLILSSPAESQNQSEEARFSFLQGGYVEDFVPQDNGKEDVNGSLALANITEKALQLHDMRSHSTTKGMAKSGAEFFATRSFHGLDNHCNDSQLEPFFMGRTGRASGYEDEKTER